MYKKTKTIDKSSEIAEIHWKPLNKSRMSADQLREKYRNRVLIIAVLIEVD